MATKTISIRVEAWERLRRARRSPDESFSEVILRAQWPERGLTAGELRAVYERSGPHLDPDMLDRIDSATHDDEAPQDKWTRS
jgi:hypothetical protein